MALASTRWSLVLRAGKGSVGALEGLCGAYWFPVYAYFRKRGLKAEDASEHTQEFFAGMLRRGDLSRVTREGGRFRNWLFTAVKHHHLKERRKAETQKRAHIEVNDAETRFETEVAPGLNPEQVFARQWALAVLESAMAHVRKDYRDRGQEEVFLVLAPALTGDADPYATLGATVGLTPGAVKVAVHRLRKRFGEALREEVADTLDGPTEIEQELRLLLDCLAGR